MRVGYASHLWSPCPAGSRDGSMGLWEVTDDVLTKSDARHNMSRVPVYAHITHKALKDIPKEDTNPDNCKVRALAFNNKNKVWAHQVFPKAFTSFFTLLTYQLLGLCLGRCTSLLLPQVSACFIAGFWVHSTLFKGWGMLVRNDNSIMKRTPCIELCSISLVSLYLWVSLAVPPGPLWFDCLSFAHAFAGAIFWVWFSYMPLKGITFLFGSQFLFILYCLFLTVTRSYLTIIESELLKLSIK